MNSDRHDGIRCETVSALLPEHLVTTAIHVVES